MRFKFVRWAHWATPTGATQRRSSAASLAGGEETLSSPISYIVQSLGRSKEFPLFGRYLSYDKTEIWHLLLDGRLYNGRHDVKRKRGYGRDGHERAHRFQRTYPQPASVQLRCRGFIIDGMGTGASSRMRSVSGNDLPSDTPAISSEDRSCKILAVRPPPGLLL